MLHCWTCGKRVYGKAVDALMIEQKRAYDLGAKDREAEALARSKAEEASRDLDRRVRMAVESRRREKVLKEESERQARLKNQIEFIEAASRLKGPTPRPKGVTCAWKECGARSRTNSKYCSRDCSNKNARWRHRQRKKQAA